MRVLVIDAAGQLWGSERALLDMIDALPDLDICVCCPPGTPLIKELQRRHVLVKPYFIANLHRKSRWWRLWAAVGVMRASISFRPKVIHLNQSGVYRVVLPTARLMNIGLVCHVRIFEDAQYLAESSPVARQLKAIVAISRAIEDEVRLFDELSTVPVHRIYDAYSRGVGPSKSFKRHPSRIACVGRVAPIKGQQVLVEAMKLAPLAHEASCWIVGDGDPDYMAEIKALSPPNVEWCGYSSNVAEILGSSSVLACPSHREPLGRVIFEAWDAGVVPVVFAGAGGAAEVVRSANAGVVYDEQTPQALADALSDAMRLSAGEVERLVANGRAWLETNCDPRTFGKAMAGVLGEAASH
jgi:glycosyltransferase involved in cell wall biosynthesis